MRVLRRGLLPALVTALAAAAAMYYLSQRQEPSYEARATVLATLPDPEYRSFGVSLVTARPLGANAYRSAATSTPVLSEALNQLPEAQSPTPAAIARLRGAVRVATDTERESTLIQLVVTDPVPEGAAQKANAVANALLQWDEARARQNLDRIIASLEEQIAGLDTQLAELDPTATDYEDRRTGLAAMRADQQNQLSAARALRNSASGLLEVLEPATLPFAPTSPRPVRSSALAFVLSIFLVYGLILLRESLDTRLRGSEDLANVSGLPVLAEFPKRARGARRLPSELTSYLRTNLIYATQDSHPKVFLIASAGPGEGKSSVAMSLAESFVRHDSRTLLVDADLRRPVMADEYKVNVRQYPSLYAHLKEPEKELKPVHVAIDLSNGLDLIHAYPAEDSPIELLSRNFRDCLERWRGKYDVIVIDSAPLLAFADALIIAPLCTGTILVADEQETDRRQVRAAVTSLQRLGVRLLGTVAVGVSDAELKKRGSSYPGYEYRSDHILPAANKAGSTRRMRSDASS